MIEITFKYKKDAVTFIRCFQGIIPSFLKEEKILSKEGLSIVQIPNEMKQVAQGVLHHFILKEKRDDWLRTMTERLFQFTDQGEQQQIINIIDSLLSGNRNELLPFLKGIEVEENVTAAIDELFANEGSFSFDSFIQFRLKSFMMNLERYVEVAIDEYKMEQEYQVFIQTLREFIRNRQAKITELHLLMGGAAIFHDRSLQEIDKDTLAKLVDRKLMFNHPVYVDSVTIAPLLSIAPNDIYMYTDATDDPLVRTIQNIFEERVHIRPYELFHHQSNLIGKQPNES